MIPSPNTKREVIPIIRSILKDKAFTLDELRNLLLHKHPKFKLDERFNNYKSGVSDELYWCLNCMRVAGAVSKTESGKWLNTNTFIPVSSIFGWYEWYLTTERRKQSLTDTELAELRKQRKQ
jgi:hypothetical protein